MNHDEWVGKWFSENGEERRYNYNLTPESVVVDLGGYQGNFASTLYTKYKCIVHVFEPIKAYALICANTNKHHPTVKVYNHGLSGTTQGKEFIALEGDGSSIYSSREGKHLEEIDVRYVDEALFDSLKLEVIDLLKINIEGGEYDVINCLLDKGYINHIKNLQVQFHDFISDAENKRNTIRERLQNTHHLTYDYPFVWENWEINENIVN